MLLLTLKLINPGQVFLLRGNHESSTCTRFYGFKGEVDAKYSPQMPDVPGVVTMLMPVPVQGVGVPIESIEDRIGEEGPTVSSIGACSPMMPPGVVPPMMRPHADAKVDILETIRYLLRLISRYGVLKIST